MKNNLVRQHLNGKDLIAIGIFSTLFYIFTMLSDFLGAIHPLAWILSPAVAAIFCSIPYLVLAAKVRKMFCVFLMCVVVWLLYLLTGRSYTWSLLIFLVVGIIAEVIRYISRYKSFFADAISYLVVSIALISSLLPLWVDNENFMKIVADMGFSKTYVENCAKYTSTSMLAVSVVAILLCGLIGIFVTRKLCKKHFKKAGLM